MRRDRAAQTATPSLLTSDYDPAVEVLPDPSLKNRNVAFTHVEVGDVVNILPTDPRPVSISIRADLPVPRLLIAANRINGSAPFIHSGTSGMTGGGVQIERSNLCGDRLVPAQCVFEHRGEGAFNQGLLNVFFRLIPLTLQ